jgi:hypothetical protein
MKSRVIPYAFALLVAVVLSLLPPAIFADLIVPFDHWNNWAARGRHVRPRFDGSNLPPVLKAELGAFKALTAPPGRFREIVMGGPTAYAAQFADTGTIYETAPVPPFVFAISHISWAIPLWFISIALLYELLRIVRDRVTTRSRGS